jgi:hypothetical protein
VIVFDGGYFVEDISGCCLYFLFEIMFYQIDEIFEMFLLELG